MFVLMLVVAAVYGPVLAIVAFFAGAATFSRRARRAIRRMIIGD